MVWFTYAVFLLATGTWGDVGGLPKKLPFPQSVFKNFTTPSMLVQPYHLGSLKIHQPPFIQKNENFGWKL